MSKQLIVAIIAVIIGIVFTLIDIFLTNWGPLPYCIVDGICIILAIGAGDDAAHPDANTKSLI